MSQVEKDQIRQQVRSTYGNIAITDDAAGSCGAGSSCCGQQKSPVGDKSLELGYSPEDLGSVPDGSNLGLGCGNPQAIAGIQKGEVVLDLGSGGGFDCFLAGQQLQGTGKVIGVDMTPEMVSKARRNAEKSGYSNVEFRLGEIENLPVADTSVDVIISNCVINLSPDKSKVFSEAFRVLKTGGRLAISDIVALKPFTEEMRQNVALYSGCVTGASHQEDILQMLKEQGFEEIAVTPKEGIREYIHKWAPGTGIEDYITSAVIQAVKR
ncbi:MAG: arsM [Paenibacillaceae bacterium]|jgi:ubiquinone/menaquinone biosynthesis C-methylase UbiE|nr:arsM [Paenibacillaceae bacterium]